MCFTVSAAVYIYAPQAVERVMYACPLSNLPRQFPYTLLNSSLMRTSHSGTCVCVCVSLVREGGREAVGLVWGGERGTCEVVE